MNIGENSVKENRFLSRNEYGIIIAIICIKLILMGLFSSSYQNIMFRPFVSVFLKGLNPYEYYYQHNLTDSFPYFPLMLIIESFGGIILNYFSPTSIFLQNLIFKLPLLIFDIIGMIYLLKLGIRFKYVILLFFLSPINVYGTYVHSQLDIIPTVLLLIAIYYLIKSKKTKYYILYSIFIGLAISTKFHIIAAIPVLFIYLIKKKGYFYAVVLHLLSAIVVCGFTVFFWGDGFVNKVIFNKDQSVLFNVFFDYGTTRVIIPILVIILFYLVLFSLSSFNKRLLLSSLCFLFAIFLICIPPMPAWYIWIVPFVTIYFNYLEEEKYQTFYIYLLFNIIYFIFFIFLHKTEYEDIVLLSKSYQFLKINNATLKYLVFTAMVSCLLIVVIKIYQFGMYSNNIYRRKGKSFVIGIAGDSGAGKSSLLKRIDDMFGGSKDVLFIEGDGDHKWGRGDKNWKNYTALNPRANFLYKQAEDIRKLKNGNYVLRSEYDHEKGQLTKSTKIKSKKFIVLSGLHSLYLPRLRNELDLKVFLNTSDSLRLHWKFKRDSLERGYSIDEIKKHIQKRLPDAVKYIIPQKEFADLVITYYDDTLIDPENIEHKDVVGVIFEFKLDFDVEPLVNYCIDSGITPIWEVGDDLSSQRLIFKGGDLKEKNIDFDKMLNYLIPQYDDFFDYDIVWNKGVDGIVQIMMLLMIHSTMKG